MEKLPLNNYYNYIIPSNKPKQVKKKKKTQTSFLVLLQISVKIKTHPSVLLPKTQGSEYPNSCHFSEAWNRSRQTGKPPGGTTARHA